MRGLSGAAGNSPRIALFVAGDRGRVGRELLAQLAEQRTAIASRHGLHFDVLGTANTQTMRFESKPPQPRAPGDWTELLERIGDRPALFVDCTASAEVAALYPQLLERGVGVVTANKLAFSGSLAEYRRLHAASAGHRAPLAYETTVGAALPVLAPLRELRARGERLTRVEAVLSGSLSFLFARINRGLAFSQALREAQALGYTEPHPARDLAGNDTARKLVILLREAGVPIEPEDVAVTPLVPASCLADPDPAHFLARIAELDARWRAWAAAEPLACLALYERGRASVELATVGPGSVFARLEPGANLIRLYTDRYAELPLAVSGPGAGTGLTAAGLLSDLLRAGRRLCEPRRTPNIRRHLDERALTRQASP